MGDSTKEFSVLGWGKNTGFSFFVSAFVHDLVRKVEVPPLMGERERRGEERRGEEKEWGKNQCPMTDWSCLLPYCVLGSRMGLAQKERERERERKAIMTLDSDL